MRELPARTHYQEYKLDAKDGSIFMKQLSKQARISSLALHNQSKRPMTLNVANTLCGDGVVFCATVSPESTYCKDFSDAELELVEDWLQIFFGTENGEGVLILGVGYRDAYAKDGRHSCDTDEPKRSGLQGVVSGQRDTNPSEMDPPLPVPCGEPDSLLLGSRQQRTNALSDPPSSGVDELQGKQSTEQKTTYPATYLCEFLDRRYKSGERCRTEDDR